MHRYDAMFPTEGCASTSRFAQFIRLTGITRHYKAAKTKNLRKLLECRPHARVRRRRGSSSTVISTKRKSQRPRARPPSSRTHSVSIIGAGRLGLALGIALSKAGYAIKLVVARSSASAKHAATLLKTTGEHVGAKGLTKPSRRSLELIASSSLIIVATPDDAIPGVAKNLAEAFQSPRFARGTRRPVAVHTSGALSSRVLQPLKTRGLSIGSIHPLISISDKNG